MHGILSDYIVILGYQFILALLLGLVPALVAKKKGRSFFRWWMFGSSLFVIAIVAVFCVSDKSGDQDLADKGLLRTCPACKEWMGVADSRCPKCGFAVAPLVSIQTAVMAKYALSGKKGERRP